MHRISSTSISHRRHGFTLIEAALVLAISSLALAGLWIAYERISQNQKIDQAQKQLTAIVNNLRSLYGNGSGFGTYGSSAPTTCTPPCDITVRMVRLGVFPPDTLRPDNTATPAREDQDPRTPWGTSWQLLDVSVIGGPRSADLIAIRTFDISQNFEPGAICSQIIARNVGASRDSGLYEVSKHQTSGGWSSTDVTDDCAGSTVCNATSAAEFCNDNPSTTGFGFRYGLSTVVIQ